MWCHKTQKKWVLDKKLQKTTTSKNGLIRLSIRRYEHFLENTVFRIQKSKKSVSLHEDTLSNIIVWPVLPVWSTSILAFGVPGASTSLYWRTVDGWMYGWWIGMKKVLWFCSKSCQMNLRGDINLPLFQFLWHVFKWIKSDLKFEISENLVQFPNGQSAFFCKFWFFHEVWPIYQRFRFKKMIGRATVVGCLED